MDFSRIYISVTFLIAKTSSFWEHLFLNLRHIIFVSFIIPHYCASFPSPSLHPDSRDTFRCRLVWHRTQLLHPNSRCHWSTPRCWKTHLPIVVLSLFGHNLFKLSSLLTNLSIFLFYTWFDALRFSCTLFEEDQFEHWTSSSIQVFLLYSSGIVQYIMMVRIMNQIYKSCSSLSSQYSFTLAYDHCYRDVQLIFSNQNWAAVIVHHVNNSLFHVT